MTREEALALVNSNLDELGNLTEFQDDEEFVLEVLKSVEDDVWDLSIGEKLKANKEFALKALESFPKAYHIDPSVFSYDLHKDRDFALKAVQGQTDFGYFKDYFGSDKEIVEFAIKGDPTRLLMASDLLKEDFTLAIIFVQGIYKQFDSVEDFWYEYEDYGIDEKLFKELWDKEETIELNKPEISISDDEQIELKIRFQLESSYENEEENIYDIQDFSARGTIEEAMKSIVEESGGYDFNDEDLINYEAESDLIEVTRELASIRINSRKCLGKCFEKYTTLYQTILDNS